MCFATAASMQGGAAEWLAVRPRSSTMTDYAQDPRPKLARYFKQLTAQQLPSPLHILLWTRELLEYLGDQAKYPIANLYGNWSVHTRISGSASGYELLSRINGQIAALHSDPAINASSGSLAPLVQSIAQQLSTSLLRREWRDLFQREGFSASFLESHSLWNHVLAGVFDEIRGKPIQRPDGDPAQWRPRVRELYTQAREEVIRTFGNARAFVPHFLVDVVHIPEKHEDASRGSLHWMCITEANVLIRAEIQTDMFEDRAAFTND